MAGYSGRRGPNVSQYLADLNTVPSAQDMAAQQPLGLDDDLALFTNTDFFDFDFTGELSDINAQTLDYDPAAEERARRQNASSYRTKQPHDFMTNNTKKDFLSGGDFQFSGYSFPNLVDPAAAATHQAQQQPQLHFHPPAQVNSPSLASPISPTASTTPAKRKTEGATDPNSAQAIEDAGRLAAEEDKRRRNTAASARFRVKKKQREQALEKTAKDMSDKVGELESKINQLETENRWLKELLTEKNDKSAEMSKQKLLKESVGTRSLGDHTTGVGTDAKDVKA